jgi:hypothetical protein
MTIMTLTTLFEEQIFIRLNEDHTALICTTKWPLFSKIKRVSVDGAGHDFAPEELPVLRRSAVEQGWTHQTLPSRRNAL